MAARHSLEALKVPPHSVEAEQSVLGALLIDNDSWVSVAERLTEDDFYRPEHREIFITVEALAHEIKPFDVVTVAERLAAQQRLAAIGGIPYLAALAENTPTAANVGAYAAIVRERAVLRKLIHAGTGIAQIGFQPEGRNVEELLDLAERQVFEIADRHARGERGVKRIRDLMVQAIDRIDTLFHSDSTITGVATGFPDLDELTAGLQPSDLVIVAGRPSMGKTAFAINIAEHAAIKDAKVVAIFSLEMPGEQLAMRMMSSLGRIDQHRVRTGKLHDEDWPRLTSAVGILSETKMFVDDSPALTPSELRARCRRIAREHGLGLIIVDYLQLMQVPGTRENRATEISEISRSLKGLAKELKVPVIALSQLNRSLEQRPDKRPRMADLRESGAIEQDADVIVFIYRDEVYDEESPHKGIAEIIVAKQRNGPIGTVRMTFLGQYTRFESFVADSYGGSASRGFG
ncbi:MAG: replicative DNA helicase [Gammaproteobacteria bacterium]